MILSLLANRDAFLRSVYRIASYNKDIPDFTKHSQAEVRPNVTRRVYDIPQIHITTFLKTATWQFLITNHCSLPIGSVRIVIADGPSTHVVNVGLSDSIPADIHDVDVFTYIERKLNMHGVEDIDDQHLILEILRDETIIRLDYDMPMFQVTPVMFRTECRVDVVFHQGDVLCLAVRRPREPCVYHVVVQHPRAQAISWAKQQLRTGYSRQVVEAVENHSMTGVQSVTAHGESPILRGVIVSREYTKLPIGSVWPVLAAAETITVMVDDAPVTLPSSAVFPLQLNSGGGG